MKPGAELRDQLREHYAAEEWVDAFVVSQLIYWRWCEAES